MRLVLQGMLLLAAVACADPTATVRQAIFSDKQLFWPELAGKARGAAPVRVKPASSKTAPKDKPPRIAVLPIDLRDYTETLPCDSCHRLSANGMEFFLENHLANRLQERFPKLDVDLVAPHVALLQSGNIDLLSYEQSLDFPWDKWFDGYQQPLIYRPRDRMASAQTRQRLDRLGGLLGVSHLLVPARMRVKVLPKSSNTHSGGLEWGFDLVFWNVAEGRPEWALDFSEKIPDMDLDKALDENLDASVKAAWDRLPKDLAALWKEEPR